MADSRLTPGVIVLDKGLNLQAPKIVAPEGSVLDGLNYEQVDFQGQKRIDGYTRYDGHLLPSDDCYLITVGTEVFLDVGTIMFVGDKLWGVVVGAGPSEGQVCVAVIDFTAMPLDGTVVGVDGPNQNTIEVTGGVWASTTDIAPEDFYGEILEHAQVLRDLVGKLPGPVAGLHWFNDRLYAVASITQLTLDGDPPEVGEQVEIRTESGNLGPFTVVAVAGNKVSIGSYDLTQYNGEVLQWGEVEADIVDVSTASAASFFEARTELQALAEDSDPYLAGWKFIHQGWVVNFAGGVSLFGSLPSLNQNIQGLGVQGPTATTGNNGRPLLLTQGIDIAGEQAQVNGWKSSLSRTSYALNPSDVWEDDSVYAYADAYISWNGATGQVSAPGVTTSVLEQYPADNKVVVEGI